MDKNKKKNIVGIDLGTTFSALAVLNSIGKSEIVPNADGERLTPSAIFFDEENSDVVQVGIEAINSRHINAERSVRWIKRHMGETDYHRSIDGKDWTVVELSSLILKKLKLDCSIQQGEITDAVISVPAHFDEIRRKAAMNAGTMAGLNVIGIVNEPVAAALHYAVTKEVSGKILVYDLGGGTFDVTIMDVNGLQIDIICSQGEQSLGGIDFDKKILKMLEDSYNGKFNVKLINSDEDKAKYEDQAEDIKKTLSRRKVARQMLYGSAGSMKIEITRDMLDEAIQPLITRTEMLVEVALGESKLKPSEIDKVILVGGSSRIPLVKKRLEKIFGFAPEISVNVDECIALGAALYAGLAMQRENPDAVTAGISRGLKDIKLTDVCNHSYGTICAPVDKETGRHAIKNYIILKKNTPLPCEQIKTFYTIAKGQTELEICITQGEDDSVEYANKIGTYKLELPDGRLEKCPIKVTYSYDVNQRMHCKFEDVESGRVLEVDYSIDQKGDMTESSMEEKAEKIDAVTIE